jgi:hypothetical protein
MHYNPHIFLYFYKEFNYSENESELPNDDMFVFPLIHCLSRVNEN